MRSEPATPALNSSRLKVPLKVPDEAQAPAENLEANAPLQAGAQGLGDTVIAPHIFPTLPTCSSWWRKSSAEP